jgi:hypothetical protein
MNVVRIATDNPKADQWKLLSQFAYPLNIKRHLEDHALPKDEEVINFIAGCLRQSEAYFTAAEVAPLDISPLLLYYSATNLLAGAVSMKTGTKQVIRHHGMNLKLPTADNPRIADFEVKPVRPEDGALQNFCNVFSDGCPLTSGGAWTVEEILGSIPDLKQDFEGCYQGAIPYSIPVKAVRRVIHKEEIVYELVDKSDIERFHRPQDFIDSIAQLTAAYLPPRWNLANQYLPLYPRIRGPKIGTHSIFGKKHLQIAHLKNGQQLTPTQLIVMYMGLYAIGYLSRYYPEKWNPFVRNDSTGERLVIEKFMAVCQRFFPNLVLNEIRGARIQFFYQTEQMIELLEGSSDQIEP